MNKPGVNVGKNLTTKKQSNEIKTVTWFLRYFVVQIETRNFPLLSPRHVV